MTNSIQIASASCYQASHESINLYQSTPINNGFGFLIEDLEDQPLATLEAMNHCGGEHWVIKTELLTIAQAKTLSSELHTQHYQFHINAGRFHITAWNLLDAHYICNLIALHELGAEHANNEATYAA